MGKSRTIDAPAGGAELPSEAKLQSAWAQGPLPYPFYCLDGEPLRVIFTKSPPSGRSVSPNG